MSFVPNNLNETTRIVGGIEARPHSWPSMAYVFVYNLETKEEGRCGGTLISENEILTAAQ
jgi:hypothetical protein